MIKNGLKLENISKYYGGVTALDDVSIEVTRGKIYGLVGENGAGKSTLMKVMNGAVQPDKGRITMDDREVAFSSPYSAQLQGVGMVYQELNLLPTLSITENLFISELSNHKAGYINWTHLHKKAKASFKEYLDMDIDPKTMVGDMKVAQQQLVAIVRALVLDCKVLILDEPTSALPIKDVKNLFAVLRTLKEKGIISIFISHKLDEVIEISDEVVALRNGKKIASITENVTEDKLTELIAGKELEERFPKKTFKKQEEILRAENVSVNGLLHNLNFTLHRGEILGIAGLLGAGKTETALSLFGAYGAGHGFKGKFFVEGKEYRPQNPQDAIRSGVGLVPEDRAREGLITDLSIEMNMTLASLRKYTRFGWVNRKQEKERVQELVSALLLKCGSVKDPVNSLSGGNQQKVVLAKWISSDIKVLIFDEPTRGIDIGAKVEIYHLMNNLVEMGIGVIITSSEIDEVRAMSDRILLLHEGKIFKEEVSAEVTDADLYDDLMDEAGGFS